MKKPCKAVLVQGWSQNGTRLLEEEFEANSRDGFLGNLETLMQNMMRVCCHAVGGDMCGLTTCLRAALQLYTIVPSLKMSGVSCCWLTMCHPTMFALVTGPQVDLAWLEAFTSAIYQCAADGLKERDKRKYMVSCIALQEIQSLTVMLFTPMVAFFFL